MKSEQGGEDDFETRPTGRFRAVPKPLLEEIDQEIDTVRRGAHDTLMWSFVAGVAVAVWMFWEYLA
jgi:hypothetical protein